MSATFTSNETCRAHEKAKFEVEARSAKSGVITLYCNSARDAFEHGSALFMVTGNVVTIKGDGEEPCSLDRFRSEHLAALH